MRTTASRTAPSTSAREIENVMSGLRQAPPDEDTDAAALERELLDQFSHFKGVGKLSAVPALVLSVYFALLQRTKQLRVRIEQLETKSLHFAGTWRPQGYKAGSLVQRHGGLWLALNATSDTPPSANWRLVVKQGAFGEKVNGHAD